MRNLTVGANIIQDNIAFHFDPANIKCIVDDGSFVWRDLSPSYLAGTMSATNTFGTNPSCIVVDGSLATSYGYTQVTPSWVSFDGTFDYTLDIWFKLNVGSRASYHMLFGYPAANPFVALLANALGGSNWQIVWRASGGTYTYSTPVLDYNVENNWINITMVCNTSNNCDLYINGVYRSSWTRTNNIFALRGVGAGYSSGGKYYCLEGFLGPAKAYNVALTADEIMQNFNAVRGRFGL